MAASPATNYLALDVGSKRIGVARASSKAKLVQPLETIEVNRTEIDRIRQLVKTYDVDTIIVGWPRNLRGEETAQTNQTRAFISRLKQLECTIVKQDEALSSVQAERSLKDRKKAFDKSDIDAEAAAIILEDYLRTVQ